MFTKSIEKLNNSVGIMISKLDKSILKKNKQINKLQTQIKYLKKGEYNTLEQKLDTQHINKILFKPINNTIVKFDVRNFFQKDENYPIFVGTTIEIVNQVLNYVKRIKIINKTKQGYSEFPFMPYETLQLQQGSEGDVQILIANLLIASGLPYYIVRIGFGSKGYTAMYYTTKWISLIGKPVFSFNIKYVY